MLKSQKAPPAIFKSLTRAWSHRSAAKGCSREGLPGLCSFYDVSRCVSQRQVHLHLKGTISADWVPKRIEDWRRGHGLDSDALQP